MTTIMLQSTDLLANWDEVIDAVATDRLHVIAALQGKPAVAIISYAAYLALQEELDDIRAGQRADQAYEEYLRDPSTARPWLCIRAEFIAAGKLDDYLSAEDEVVPG